MNCIYDCSYCYLKGMYPSGHMVLFVNIEDYLEELDHILKTQNMYVCISYDADLLAMEAVTGYVRLWSAYAAKHENLKLEIRTKCALPCDVGSALSVQCDLCVYPVSAEDDRCV